MVLQGIMEVKEVVPSMRTYIPGNNKSDTMKRTCDEVVQDDWEGNSNGQRCHSNSEERE